MSDAAASSKPYLAPAYDYEEARRIADDLDLADPVAITLVRRGHRTVEAARSFLAADETHDPGMFEGIEGAIEAISAAIGAGRRVTVHGDYDVDGICSTAIMVAALRRLGADCDWLIPDRLADGYGLSASTISELRERGTGLLVTVDCGIGSVEEVGSLRADGIGVVITDHHQAGDVLPDCPIVHPIVGEYPFEGLCGAAVAAKLAQALEAAEEVPDPDLVALATVADLVPLVGENRALVRRGLNAIRRRPRAGIRALAAISNVDPEHLDEGDVAFRLGPRLNAAGRLYRADAGVELMLTDDPARAETIASELDAANHERRETERAVSNEAEAALRALSDDQRALPVIVVAGEGWHPGVVGIVASRLVERHERPAIVLAVGDGVAKGSGRSIAGFDLLAGLDACADLLTRYGGHRAAAGLEMNAADVDRFRDAFARHAVSVVPEEGLGEPERIDAIVGAEALDLDTAEQLAALAPFGRGNPDVKLLVPGARVGDVRPMGEEGRHARFNLSTGTLSARGVAFNANGVLAAAQREPHDIAVRLEVNRWNGAVEPRAVLADAFARESASESAEDGHSCSDEAGATDAWWARFDAELARDPSAPRVVDAHAADGRRALDGRRGSPVARISELLSSGERVLVVTSDAARRSALVRAGTIGGALGARCVCHRCPAKELERLAAETECNVLVTDWTTLASAPCAGLAFDHLVLVDPPADPRHLRLASDRTGDGYLHTCWAPAEELAERCWDAEWEQRAVLAEVYRGLGGSEVADSDLLKLLTGASRYARSPEAAARAILVLTELGLAECRMDGGSRSLRVVSSERTELEQSGAYRAFSTIHQEGRAYLQSRRAEP